MEIILPNTNEIKIVNSHREFVGGLMQNEDPNRPLLLLDGSCSVDPIRYPSGQLASEVYVEDMYMYRQNLLGIATVARWNGSKPRSGEDRFTGILHTKGGTESYGNAASRLTGLD